MIPDTSFPAFLDQATSLILPGPVGSLEVLVSFPKPTETHPGVAIVCHPHPQHGGSMHNKVVTIVERSLRELGFITLRFNFRGVGGSEGDFDEGHGETDDLLTVAHWVMQTRPGNMLWLAGFSFGSYVAVRAIAQLPTVRQLILVAPPVNRWDFTLPDLPECSCLVVQGEEDEIVDPNAVYAWVSAQAKSLTLIRMPETDHFFHRRLMDLRGALKNALRPNLPALSVMTIDD